MSAAPHPRSPPGLAARPARRVRLRAVGADDAPGRRHDGCAGPAAAVRGGGACRAGRAAGRCLSAGGARALADGRAMAASAADGDLRGVRLAGAAGLRAAVRGRGACQRAVRCAAAGHRGDRRLAARPARAAGFLAVCGAWPGPGARLRVLAGRRAPECRRRLAAAGRGRRFLRLRAGGDLERDPASPAGDLLGGAALFAADPALEPVAVAGRRRRGRAAVRLGRTALRRRGFDVAGLLRLVPRAGPGRRAAHQPGAGAASPSCRRCWRCRCSARPCSRQRWASSSRLWQRSGWASVRGPPERRDERRPAGCLLPCSPSCPRSRRGRTT